MSYKKPILKLIKDETLVPTACGGQCRGRNNMPYDLPKVFSSVKKTNKTA